MPAQCHLVGGEASVLLFPTGPTRPATPKSQMSARSPGDLHVTKFPRGLCTKERAEPRFASPASRVRTF